MKMILISCNGISKLVNSPSFWGGPSAFERLLIPAFYRTLLPSLPEQFSGINVWHLRLELVTLIRMHIVVVIENGFKCVFMKLPNWLIARSSGSVPRRLSLFRHPLLTHFCSPFPEHFRSYFRAVTLVTVTLTRFSIYFRAFIRNIFQFFRDSQAFWKTIYLFRISLTQLHQPLRFIMRWLLFIYHHFG